jgi:hypothetical protein
MREAREVTGPEKVRPNFDGDSLSLKLSLGIRYSV